MSISGSVAYCVGTLSGKYNENTNKVSTILQARLTSDSPWQYYGSWRGTSTGTSEARAEGSKGLISGYQYRVYVSGTITSPAGTVLERPSTSTSPQSY